MSVLPTRKKAVYGPPACQEAAADLGTCENTVILGACHNGHSDRRIRRDDVETGRRIK